MSCDESIYKIIYFREKLFDNVGDTVGPYLYNYFCSRTEFTAHNLKFHVQYLCDKHNTKKGGLIMTGSMLHQPGTQWGTGIMHPDRVVSNPNVYAVRGPLSYKSLTPRHPLPYGDPALLLPLFIKKPITTPSYRLGIIPHYVDLDRVQKDFGGRRDILIINVKDDLTTFIKQLCKCEHTVSSSLHGMIISSAYGIPTRRVKFSKKVCGGNTKFYDFMLSMKHTMTEPEICAISQSLKLDKWKNCLPTRYIHWECLDFTINNIFRIPTRVLCEKTFRFEMPSEMQLGLLRSCPILKMSVRKRLSN
jgi:pyruvyltransferase